MYIIGLIVGLSLGAIAGGALAIYYAVKKYTAWPGKVVKRNDGAEYIASAYQYATTSTPSSEMNPSMIIYVSGKDHISDALRKATKAGLKVAVRTGGHQYCGASSTDGDNIQLDLSQTFKECVITGRRAYVGVSVKLMDLIASLRDHGLFVPTGCCGHVCVGGHCQTGGYGLLTRCLGLFSDHLVELHVVMPNGDQRVVTKADQDLWFALLGGSPGNYAIVTHVVIETHRDIDYPDSRGLVINGPAITEDRLKRAFDLLRDTGSNVPDDSALFHGGEFVHSSAIDRGRLVECPWIH